MLIDTRSNFFGEIKNRNKNETSEMPNDAKRNFMTEVGFEPTPP